MQPLGIDPPMQGDRKMRVPMDPLGVATMGGRSSRQNLAEDARTSPTGGIDRSPPTLSGVRRESFPPRAREAASIHTNAPMDSAESPSGIIVGNNPASRHLDPTH